MPQFIDEHGTVEGGEPAKLSTCATWPAKVDALAEFLANRHNSVPVEQQMLSRWVSYCPEEKGAHKINKTYLDCLFMNEGIPTVARLSGSFIVTSSGDGRVVFDMDLVRIMYSTSPRTGKVLFPGNVREGEVALPAMTVKRLEIGDDIERLSMNRNNDRALLSSIVDYDWMGDTELIELPIPYIAVYDETGVKVRDTVEAQRWFENYASLLDVFSQSPRILDGRALLPLDYCDFCVGVPYLDIQGLPPLMHSPISLSMHNSSHTLFIRFKNNCLVYKNYTKKHKEWRNHVPMSKRSTT